MPAVLVHSAAHLVLPKRLQQYNTKEAWCTTTHHSAIPFFNIWHHIMMQPNLCLSHMHQLNISTTSMLGPTIQPTLGPITSYLLLATINTSVKMGHTVPPIRAFTMGKTHCQSQAMCTFLGKLKLIGLTVVINLNEHCGF